LNGCSARLAEVILLRFKLTDDLFQVRDKLQLASDVGNPAVIPHAAEAQIETK
jgi:hypothetical protein